MLQSKGRDFRMYMKILQPCWGELEAVKKQESSLQTLSLGQSFILDIEKRKNTKAVNISKLRELSSLESRW